VSFTLRDTSWTHMGPRFSRCGSIILAAWFQSVMHFPVYAILPWSVLKTCLVAGSVTRKRRERDRRETGSRLTDHTLLSSCHQFLKQEFLVCSSCHLLPSALGLWPPMWSCCIYTAHISDVNSSHPPFCTEEWQSVSSATKILNSPNDGYQALNLIIRLLRINLGLI
jgi:hypothetical protein